MTPYMECFDLPFFFSPISLGLMPAMTGTSFLSLSLFFFFSGAPCALVPLVIAPVFTIPHIGIFQRTFFLAIPGWRSRTDRLILHYGEAKEGRVQNLGSIPDALMGFSCCILLDKTFLSS